MGSHHIPFCYREGESLYPEELVLYALLKLTGSPLYGNATVPGLASERETVIKYNASVVCASLSQVFAKSYHKEDLYYYLCLMKSLTPMQNPSKIGLFCGQPRDVAFEPYVELLLNKAAWALSSIVRSENSVVASGVKETAITICGGITEGSLNVHIERYPSLIFAELWLSIANFPGWKYEQNERELLLWKPCISRPYVAEKVVRIFEDLQWEIEIPGRKTSHQEGLANSQLVLVNILKSVDNASVCQGMPKSQVPATQLAQRLPRGSSIVYDGDGSVVARDNGDFLLSAECQGLVLPRDRRCNAPDRFPNVCQACIDLLKQLGNYEPPTDKSFEAETLNLIARLNIELSERKQQVMNLWERFSKQRETNRKLQKRVEENEKMQISVVTVGEEWLKLHTRQKKELREAMK